MIERGLAWLSSRILSLNDCTELLERWSRFLILVHHRFNHFNKPGIEVLLRRDLLDLRENLCLRGRSLQLLPEQQKDAELAYSSRHSLFDFFSIPIQVAREHVLREVLDQLNYLLRVLQVKHFLFRRIPHLVFILLLLRLLFHFILICYLFPFSRFFLIVI